MRQSTTQQTAFLALILSTATMPLPLNAQQALEEVIITEANHSLFSARMDPDLAPAFDGTMVNAEGLSAGRGTFGNRNDKTMEGPANDGKLRPHYRVQVFSGTTESADVARLYAEIADEASIPRPTANT